MTRLVGIAGLARSGKDTLAQGFVKLGYRRVAFADALKEATALIANEPSHLYFGEASKEEHTEALGMTRRKALQSVGKAVRDCLGPQTWVNRVLRDWHLCGRYPMVISDLRYPNEAQAILLNGGTVVRVHREGSGLPGEAGLHESEWALSEDQVDIEVYNNGTVGDLHAEAVKIDRDLGDEK